MAGKSTTTIRQVLRYQPYQVAWFAVTKALFNQVVACYFEVIQAHEKLLDLKNKDALTTLEMLQPFSSTRMAIPTARGLLMAYRCVPKACACTPPTSSPTPTATVRNASAVPSSFPTHRRNV
jgi:hypothetical protein